VLARFFQLSEERSLKIIKRILGLSRTKQNELFNQILRDFSKRHRSVVSILEKNYKRVSPLIKKLSIEEQDITYQEHLIIGA